MSQHIAIMETSEKVIARSEATKQSFENTNKIKIASAILLP